MATDDFDKKTDKKELQRWMESNCLEAAVAPGKYTAAEAAGVGARHVVVVAAAAAVVVVVVVVVAAAAVAVESHLKAKSGWPLDTEMPEQPWTG